MGIAYAAPDMQGGNFWGVINHDNEEGIIRIADNKVTRGLKMWTWGFPSFTNQTDPRKDPNEARPYVELWAGVSDEFFHSAEFPARGEVSIPETYSPTVGMSNVTHANENILINLAAEACERESSVLQYRAGRAVARHAETRRRCIVRRRRDGRPEARKPHCCGDSCRRQRTGAADNRYGGPETADRGRDGNQIRRDTIRQKGIMLGWNRAFLRCPQQIVIAQHSIFAWGCFRNFVY